MAASPVGCSPSAAISRMTLPKVTEFIVIQSPLPAFYSELADACGRVFADDVEPGGVTQQTSQRADGAARNACAAGRLAASTFLPAARGLAGGDISLHALDVASG